MGTFWWVQTPTRHDNECAVIPTSVDFFKCPTMVNNGFGVVSGGNIFAPWIKGRLSSHGIKYGGVRDAGCEVEAILVVDVCLCAVSR